VTTPQTFYDHAQEGFADGRGPEETPSLQQASALWSQAAHGGYRARSVLGQLHLSANGSSARDAARQLADGSFLPTTNGSSDSTNEADTPLRLVGNI